MTGCISICFLTGKINFDHLIKVVFARFLYKATLFLFVSNKYLVGNTLRLCKYSISYTLTHYINIHWWFLPATNRFGKWWSSSPIIPASFINWDSTVRKSSSASLTHLINYLYLYGFMDICFILWVIIHYCILILMLSWMWPLGAPLSWHPVCFW